MNKYINLAAIDNSLVNEYVNFAAISNVLVNEYVNFAAISNVLVIPKTKYMTLGPEFFCCSKMIITRRRKHLQQ